MLIDSSKSESSSNSPAELDSCSDVSVGIISWSSVIFPVEIASVSPEESLSMMTYLSVRSRIFYSSEVIHKQNMRPEVQQVPEVRFFCFLLIDND
jgi:hypothetical protein